MQSLRAVCDQMLPISSEDASLSLRRLWSTCRFRPSDAPAQISARAVLNRHDPSFGMTGHAMLTYNTYLLKADIDIVGLIRELAKPPGSDIPIFGPIIKAVGAIPEDLADGVIQLVGGSGIVSIKKPDISERTAEIAQALTLGQGGDIIALCELWQEQDFKTIADTLTKAGIKFSSVRGPAIVGDYCVLGSGLAVFGVNLSVSTGPQHVFSNAGSRLADTDAWARKSVMLSLVQTRDGIIDLYSCHLHSGDDFPDGVYSALGKIHVNKPTDQQSQDIRFAQVREIADFISQTHNKNHIAILVGDFNTDGNNAQYLARGLVVPSIRIKIIWAYERR
jgi:hypothetical protein